MNRKILVPVAALVAAACGITDPPDDPSRGVVDLTATPAAAPADGVSTVLLSATVDTAVRPESGEVRFTTTAGSLLPASGVVAADPSGVASVQLRAPNDSAVALVTAVAGTVARTTEVVFVPAPPTDVEVRSAQFTLTAGIANSVEVTATLLRDVGTPSPGATVTFAADTAGGSGGAFGRFSTSSARATSQAVTTRFSAGNTPYRGPVMITATATRNGRTVVDTTVVEVVP